CGWRRGGFRTSPSVARARGAGKREWGSERRLRRNGLPNRRLTPGALRRLFSADMVRTTLQVLVLPLLFALLGAGGNATFCAVLSVVGLEAHHHPSHGGNGTDHAGPFCLHSHEEEDCEHRGETTPCPESCELRLSEALTPGLVKVPALAAAILAPAAFEIPVAAVAASVHDRAAAPDPPDRRPLLSAPPFTGRFLI